MLRSSFTQRLSFWINACQRLFYGLKALFTKFSLYVKVLISEKERKELIFFRALQQLAKKIALTDEENLCFLRKFHKLDALYRHQFSPAFLNDRYLMPTEQKLTRLFELTRALALKWNYGLSFKMPSKRYHQAILRATLEAIQLENTYLLAKADGMGYPLTLAALKFLRLLDMKTPFPFFLSPSPHLKEEKALFIQMTSLPPVAEMEDYIYFFTKSGVQTEWNADQIHLAVWSRYFFLSLHLKYPFADLSFSQTVTLLIYYSYLHGYFARYKPKLLLKAFNTLLTDLHAIHFAEISSFFTRDMEMMKGMQAGGPADFLQHLSKPLQMIFSKLDFHLHALHEHTAKAKLSFKILRKLQRLSSKAQLSDRQSASFLRHVDNLYALFEDKGVWLHLIRLNRKLEWEDYCQLTEEAKNVIRLRILAEALSLKWDCGIDLGKPILMNEDEVDFAHHEAALIENTYKLLKAKQTRVLS